MARKQKPPRDVVIARLRPHARALFWPTFLLVAVAGAFGYFGGRLPEEWQNWAVLAAAMLLVLFGWFIPLCRWLAKRYTITNRRVIVRDSGGRQEVLHSGGYDITVRKRGLQSLFKSGDVLIGSGPDSSVVLRDVPSVNLVQETLHELVQSNRQELSVGPLFLSE